MPTEARPCSEVSDGARWRPAWSAARRQGAAAPRLRLPADQSWPTRGSHRPGEVNSPKVLVASPGIQTLAATRTPTSKTIPCAVETQHVSGRDGPGGRFPSRSTMAVFHRFAFASNNSSHHLGAFAPEHQVANSSSLILQEPWSLPSDSRGENHPGRSMSCPKGVGRALGC